MTPFFRYTIIAIVLIVIAAATVAKAAVVAVTEGKYQVVVSNTVQPGTYDTMEECEKAKAAKGAEIGATRTSGELWLKCQKADRYRFGAPRPPEPPAETWTQCSQEGELCAFTGTRRVRYGAGEGWAVRDIVAINGGVQCGNTVFGDPVFGVRKSCELSSVIPPQQPEPPAPTVGSASLSWHAPTHNVDGTPLTNLAGYFIAYGATCDARTETVQVADPQRTSHTIQGLAPGPYCFAVNAVSTEGAMSEPSDTAQKVVR